MSGLRRLPPTYVRQIHIAIDNLFDKFRATVLGKKYSRELRVSVKQALTLPGLYEGAAYAEQHKPDPHLLTLSMQLANEYLTAEQERCKAQVVNAIQAAAREVSYGKPVNFEGLLLAQLADIFGKTRTHIKRIVATEANNVKNLSLLDAALKFNSLRNVQDPVIYWKCVFTEDTPCEECNRLHLLEDNKTPRVWKLSEVGHGYHKKGDPEPKVGGLHPNCQCVLLSVLPGFGFGVDGGIKYIGPSHNEFNKQRGVKDKSAA